MRLALFFVTVCCLFSGHSFLMLPNTFANILIYLHSLCETDYEFINDTFALEAVTMPEQTMNPPVPVRTNCHSFSLLTGVLLPRPSVVEPEL